MLALHFIASVLAVFWLAEGLARYDGAFGIFRRVRSVFKDLSCVFCLSFWLAIPFAFYLSQDIPFIISLFGISGGAAYLSEYLNS